MESSDAPSLTPHGRLLLTSGSSRIQQAFERGSGHGLLFLGIDEPAAALPPVLAWWRDFGVRYVTALCAEQENNSPPVPAHDELEDIAGSAPPMTGAEYLTAAVLESLWVEIGKAFKTELSEAKTSVQDFL